MESLVGNPAVTRTTPAPRAAALMSRLPLCGPLRVTVRSDDVALAGVDAFGAVDRDGTALVASGGALRFGLDESSYAGATLQVRAGGEPVIRPFGGPTGIPNTPGWLVEATPASDLLALRALGRELELAAGSTPPPSALLARLPPAALAPDDLRVAWDEANGLARASALAARCGLPLATVLQRIGRPRATYLTHAEIEPLLAEAPTLAITVRAGGATLTWSGRLARTRLVGSWLEAEGAGLVLRFRAKGSRASSWGVRFCGDSGPEPALVVCDSTGQAAVCFVAAAAAERESLRLALSEARRRRRTACRSDTPS